MPPVALLEPAVEPAQAPATAPAAASAAEPPLIELASYDLRAALALERELGISHVMAQVLVRRGIDDVQAARTLLEPRERHDPALFAGIDRAIAAIRRHIAAGSRIVVHGDYDVDGVCATAILVRALRSLGADPRWYIPSRSEDGYGLAASTVARLAARGTGLLITVDCGITAVAEIAAATAAGMEAIVTDHHAPRSDGELPECPIVHPAVCGYPASDLCGSAVAHKLAEALGATTVDEDLELVALATVADLVPLQGENRRLVREGLARLAGTARPGLRALMDVSRTDPSALDASCLGFRLAPRLNAAGRLQRADAALELLLTEDPQRAGEIAAELDRVNSERRAVEQRIWWEAERLAEEMGERAAYVLAAEGWHAGVIGIVASRVVERFHRPAILVALAGADRPGQGSGRSIPGFDLLGALHAAAPHLVTYGGHRAAAGLTLLPGDLDALRHAVEAHAEELLTPELLRRRESVDAVVSATELTLSLAEELLALEPCGLGNPSAKLLVSGARFSDVRPLGDGRHARFNVSSGGARASAIAFGCDGKVPHADTALPLDASFRLERNVWRGVVEPRLVLRQAALCRPAPVTVIGEPDDYVAAALDELARELPEDAGVAGDRGRGGSRDGELRTILDRRCESPLAVLADAGATGGAVLAVCAEVSRRVGGLAERAGGFALVAHEALRLAPELADNYEQLVILDPPTSADADALLRRGRGYAHVCWGEPELRFAEQMHELEYGLRTSLVTLYRAVRDRGRVAGEEFERLLRGDERHPRPARLAGRLVRVLAELELVSLDRTLPALSLASVEPTELERSASYRAYTRRYEEGVRFLNRAQPRRT
jgi:single-stranded-DNA-specific exonuclease